MVKFLATNLRVHYACLMYTGVRNNIQCTKDNLKAKENDKP